MEQVQNTNVSNETVEGGATEVNKVQEVEVKQEKTFTQEELDKILNKKFAQWQKKTEEAKIEAERKAKLTEAEKLAEERKEFEAMRKQFEYEKRVNSTSKALASSIFTGSQSISLQALDVLLSKKAINIYSLTSASLYPLIVA